MNQKRERPHISFGTIEKLKQSFDKLVQLIRGSDIGLELPAYFVNFDEFEKLNKSIAIENLHHLMLQFDSSAIIKAIFTLVCDLNNKQDEEPITFLAYHCVNAMTHKVCELDKVTFDAIGEYVENINYFVFVLKKFPDDAPIEKILKVIDDFFQLIKQGSFLYHKNLNGGNKSLLLGNLFLLKTLISDYLIKMFRIILKNDDSSVSFSNIERVLDSLNRILEIKGIRSFFGGEFVDCLKAEEEFIKTVQQIDRFLLFDFSKPVKENLILVWLDNFLQIELSILEGNFRNIKKYDSQVNHILLGHSFSCEFKKKVIQCHEKFKQRFFSENLKNHFSANNGETQKILQLLGDKFFDPIQYEKYNRNTKFTFKVDMQNIAKKYPTYISFVYCCFHIELLNHISFFSDGKLELKTKELQDLLEKLLIIQKSSDLTLKYLIQGRSPQLLYFFVAHVAIPNVSLENEQQIEKLFFTKGVLNYLWALQKLYALFCSITESLNLGWPKNEALSNFEIRLKDEECSLKKKVETLEKAQERLIPETMHVVITYFRLNALGYFQTEAKGYVKKYCYRTKLAALSNVLTKNFPDLALNQPEVWTNFIQKTLSNNFTPLVFIVGAFYQEKGDYQTALLFYSHCLEKNLFEMLTENNRGLYLITQELIKERVATCKNFLKKEAVSPEDAQFSSVTTEILPLSIVINKIF